MNKSIEGLNAARAEQPKRRPLNDFIARQSLSGLGGRTWKSDQLMCTRGHGNDGMAACGELMDDWRYDNDCQRETDTLHCQSDRWRAAFVISLSLLATRVCLSVCLRLIWNQNFASLPTQSCGRHSTHTTAWTATLVREARHFYHPKFSSVQFSLLSCPSVRPSFSHM